MLLPTAESGLAQDMVAAMSLGYLDLCPRASLILSTPRWSCEEGGPLRDERRDSGCARGVADHNVHGSDGGEVAMSASLAFVHDWSR